VDQGGRVECENEGATKYEGENHSREFRISLVHWRAPCGHCSSPTHETLESEQPSAQALCGGPSHVFVVRHPATTDSGMPVPERGAGPATLATEIAKGTTTSQRGAF